MKKIFSSKGFSCDCGHKSVLCWLIGFIVVAIVFCAGFKLGEWKVYFHAYEQDYYNYQPGEMMRWGNPGYGMMRGWRNYQTALPTEDAGAEATTTTTTQK